MSCGLAFRKCNSTDPLAAPPLPMCTDTCNTFNSVRTAVTPVADLLCLGVC